MAKKPIDPTIQSAIEEHAAKLTAQHQKEVDKLVKAHVKELGVQKKSIVAAAKAVELVPHEDKHVAAAVKAHHKNVLAAISE